MTAIRDYFRPFLKEMFPLEVVKMTYVYEMLKKKMLFFLQQELATTFFAIYLMCGLESHDIVFKNSPLCQECFKQIFLKQHLFKDMGNTHKASLILEDFIDLLEEYIIKPYVNCRNLSLENYSSKLKRHLVN